MKCLIEIKLIDELGDVIVKKEALTFESACEALGKLESYINRQEVAAEMFHEAEEEGN